MYILGHNSLFNTNFYDNNKNEYTDGLFTKSGSSSSASWINVLLLRTTPRPVEY